GFGGFGDNSLLFNPLGNPGAFGLSELGEALRLTSVDPTRIRENIDAVHVLDDGRLILSTATSAVLGSNVLSFRNGDLVEYNPTTDVASLIFSESVFVDVPTGQLRSGENIDAVSVLSGGDLVISTAGAARIGNLVFSDGDLVRYNRVTGVATLLLSEELFSGGSDINALHVVESGGQITRLILSTDGPGTIRGVLYDDGDLIEIINPNLANGTLGAGAVVRRYLAESVFEIGGTSGDPTENIDAVSLVPDGAEEAVVLSTVSGAAFVGLGSAFRNGDLVRLSGGGSELDRGTIHVDAELALLFEEDPANGDRSFFGEGAGYREKADFGAADPEVTFGLYLKSQGTTDFVAQEQSTRGEENSAPRIGPVVINEMMYNPAAGGVEFIELLNISAFSVVLAGPPDIDPNAVVPAWRFTNGVVFSFPADATLAAGAYALVLPQPSSGNFAAFAANFRSTNNVPASVTIYGPYDGRLNNGGEPVEISRPGNVELDGTLPDVLIDRVNYDNSAPWPVEPAGGGPSLSRFVSADFGNDVINWLPSGPAGSSSATPGRSNTTVDVTPPSAPQDIRTSVISGTRIDVSWQPAIDPHSGISGYNVYRNGVLIAQTPAFSTRHNDTTVVGSTIYTYEISAVNGNQIEGPLSSSAVAAVLTLTSTEVPSVTEVRVRFSEQLDEASAEVLGKYVIVGPTNITILSARLDGQDPSGSTVILTTTPLRERTTYQLTVSGVAALGGNTMSQTPQTVPVVVPDHTAPRITGLQVTGSGWSADFLAGRGALSIPGGPQQLATIPWSGMDRIIIHFSENVDVQSGDLGVFGVNVPFYEFANFEYNAAALTATWTLADSPRADKLLLDLSDRVKDNGGNPIDGNWQNGVSTFPSGNGVSESADNFRFQLNVLPGDGSGSGVVDRGDLIDVIHHLGGSTARGLYESRLDLNTDGLIDIADLRAALLRQGSALPSGQPIVLGSAPALATDVVFERLGAAAAAQVTVTSESTDPVPTQSRRVTSTDQPLSRHRHRARRHSASDAAISEEFSTDSSTPAHRIASRRRGV
ncbi:MAG: hypothetical protein IIA67_09685, partial [Planctomycetes bacterium]|nr:hypothetical protein [Planctomycetota bacterium]